MYSFNHAEGSVLDFRAHSTCHVCDEAPVGLQALCQRSLWEWESPCTCPAVHRLRTFDGLTENNIYYGLDLDCLPMREKCIFCCGRSQTWALRRWERR